jgi:hypothetical protein
MIVALLAVDADKLVATEGIFAVGDFEQNTPKDKVNF